MGAEPFATYGAEGGVRVEVFDESRTYGYANLFQVKLRVVACIPGDEEPYERTLEKLGVSDGDLHRVRGELVARFEEASLPYLLRPDFPEKLAAHRERSRAKGRRVVSFPVSP